MSCHSRAPRQPRPAILLGVVLGSLGRGMQEDEVWAHLPAAPGPITAVPLPEAADGG